MLAAAIARRRLSLRELSERLAARGVPVSVGALSTWRSGHRRPERGASLDALPHLEELLDLPSGSLVAHLGPSRRVGPEGREDYDVLIGRDVDLQAMDEAVGCVPPTQLDGLGGVTIVDVAADRRSYAVSRLTRWRARVDGAVRAPRHGYVESPASEPQVEVRSGARVGRTAWCAQTGYFVWEMLLDRPLPLGETTMSSDVARVEESSDVIGYSAVAERRVTSADLWVRFKGTLPTAFSAVEDSAAGLQRRAVRPVGSTVHLGVLGFGPGVYRLEWTW